MRQFLILFALLIGSYNTFSQDSVVVVINVIDDNTKESVHNVNVLIHNGVEDFRETTNGKGIVTFIGHPQERYIVQLSHEKYISANDIVSVPKRYVDGDTLFKDIEMKFESIKTQTLDEMTVLAPGVPLPVYKSKRLHVEDFEVQNDGNILLLTYPKRLKKGSELILYDGRQTLNNFQVPDKAKELVRDYRGNPHVVCENKVYGIHSENSTIGISSLEKDYYMKYLAPILDTNSTKMYFSTFNPDYPAFEYFAYDQLDSTYSKIIGVEDDLMMELYRAEYKWMDIRTKLWAANKEIQTGIDKEIWVGANYFTKSIYYKEVYAPLFHRNDSLFIFDYYKDKLYTFDKEGDILDSVGIYHHYQPKRTGWKKQLIQDRKTGQIYAVFDRGGYSYLGWVDTKTGEITQHVKLEYRYVNRIKVHGNFIYYTYRPFESTQKKFLYKERLPYDFGKALVPNGDELVEKNKSLRN
ncbi:MAG: hypothetical protein MK066_12870 [Crocinitomicaceae bacterium]|nr:hypothetical protein [Crocinitomicaceae bacterium]